MLGFMIGLLEIVYFKHINAVVRSTVLSNVTLLVGIFTYLLPIYKHDVTTGFILQMGP